MWLNRHTKTHSTFYLIHSHIIETHTYAYCELWSQTKWRDRDTLSISLSLSLTLSITPYIYLSICCLLLHVLCEHIFGVCVLLLHNTYKMNQKMFLYGSVGHLHPIFIQKLNAGEFMLVVCQYNSHDSTKAYSKHQVSHIDVCMGAENFNIDIFIFNGQCAPCHKFTNMYKMYVQSTAAAFTVAVSPSMISTIFQCNFF